MPHDNVVLAHKTSAISIIYVHYTRKLLNAPTWAMSLRAQSETTIIPHIRKRPGKSVAYCISSNKFQDATVCKNIPCKGIVSSSAHAAHLYTVKPH